MDQSRAEETRWSAGCASRHYADARQARRSPLFPPTIGCSQTKFPTRAPQRPASSGQRLAAAGIAREARVRSAGDLQALAPAEMVSRGPDLDGDAPIRMQTLHKTPTDMRGDLS
jgi:hypothetical protein